MGAWPTEVSRAQKLASRVGRLQKNQARALRLVERKITATCAEWGAEYVTGEFIEGRHSRSDRSIVGHPGIMGLVCGVCF
jgi:hypothetical protein